MRTDEQQEILDLLFENYRTAIKFVNAETMKGRLQPMDPSSSQRGGIVITPKPAILHVSPLGFWTHANDFLDASLLLSEKRGRTTFVSAFLACRAIELGLKAFLLATGDRVSSVKGARHNIIKALAESDARGLQVVVELSEREREVLESVNNQYTNNKLAYYDLFASVAEPRNPDLDFLQGIARRLIGGIERGCLAAADGVWNPLASRPS